MLKIVMLNIPGNGTADREINLEQAMVAWLESCVAKATAEAKTKAKGNPHAMLQDLYAQQAKAGTLEFVEWEYKLADGLWRPCVVAPNWNPETEYRCSTSPGCKIMLEGGEVQTMPFARAQRLFDSTFGKTHDWFYKHAGVSDYVAINYKNWSFNKAATERASYSYKRTPKLSLEQRVRRATLLEILLMVGAEKSKPGDWGNTSMCDGNDACVESLTEKLNKLLNQ